MIKSQNYIITDNQGQELEKGGSVLFNCYANEGDIHQYAAGYLPSHWHPELEIFVLLEGHIQINIADCTYELQANEGCFINTGVIHSFRAIVPEPCHYRSFVFGAEIVGGVLGSIFDINYVRPLLESGIPFLKFQKDTDNYYFKEFDKAFQACLTETYGYEFVIRNTLSGILLYTRSLSTHENSHSLFSTQEKRLKQMLLWIDQHLNEEIAVSGIADAASICPRECQRIFHQYLHCRPIEYVLRKRIFYATRLLSDTDKPVTEIALLCGFSNPSYFSKRFREYIGSTPNTYRDTCQTVIRTNPDPFI